MEVNNSSAVKSA